MPADQYSSRELMAMVDNFSGYRIDPKYFPDMLKSSIIIESLRYIYILHKNRKLSLKDEQEIKKIFKEKFIFFALPCDELPKKKYSKKYFVLSLIFFILSVFSATASIFFPVIFGPLFFIFTVSLLAYTCLINIKATPREVTEIHNNFKQELFALKYNLNQLKNLLADKYQIKTNYNFFDRMTELLGISQANSQTRKKSVSFAPKLNELNMFFQESYEFRSRSNSFENNVGLRPKG